jgi:hypothetical protein
MHYSRLKFGVLLLALLLGTGAAPIPQNPPMPAGPAIPPSVAILVPEVPIAAPIISPPAGVTVNAEGSGAPVPPNPVAILPGPLVPITGAPISPPLPVPVPVTGSGGASSGGSGGSASGSGGSGGTAGSGGSSGGSSGSPINRGGSDTNVTKTTSGVTVRGAPTPPNSNFEPGCTASQAAKVCTYGAATWFPGIQEGVKVQQCPKSSSYAFLGSCQYCCNEASATTASAGPKECPSGYTLKVLHGVLGCFDTSGCPLGTKWSNTDLICAGPSCSGKFYCLKPLFSELSNFSKGVGKEGGVMSLGCSAAQTSVMFGGTCRGYTQQEIDALPGDATSPGIKQAAARAFSDIRGGGKMLGITTTQDIYIYCTLGGGTTPISTYDRATIYDEATIAIPIQPARAQNYLQCLFNANDPKDGGIGVILPPTCSDPTTIALEIQNCVQMRNSSASP